MNELAGKQLGAYRILEQIGAGGMATVYKAYQAAMDRYVAVKVLPEQMGANAELRKRFEREAKVVARLEHAHILPVYDSGEAGNRLYLAMRYIEAGTLKERMDQGRLGLEEANRILHQLGGALDYAHRLNVVHRDVKPSNVLVDAQGDCYLTDFGLARMLEASVKLTATGVGIGTPAYMSPEQGRGEKVDARSDIYSLGVMLYEMVTRRVPFEADTPMAVVLKHITEPLPLPSSIDPTVSSEIERVILKALAKDPSDRFQSVREMVEAFDAAVQLGVEEQSPPESLAATPWSAPETRLPVPERASKLRWLWIAGGVGVLVLILMIAFFVVLSQIPLKVQIRDGQLEVVRVVEMTPTTDLNSLAESTATVITEAAEPGTTQATPTSGEQSASTATTFPEPSSFPTVTPTPLPPTPTAPPIDLEVVPLALLNSDQVRDIVWSHDGALLIVGTYHIRIYDAQTLDEVYVIDSVQWASAVALSGDDKMLAAASHDGIGIWETGGWGEVLALPGSQDAESVAFSPDGTQIAAGVGSAVKIWELPDGREVRTLPGSSGRAVVFSPDGRLLAASGGVAGQEIKLWDVTSGDELPALTGHTNWVNTIDFSPDGQTLASGATDSTVRIWDVETGRQVRAFMAHTGQVESVAFAPDGRVLASASWDLTVKLWDTATGQELASLTGHTAWCQSVAFSPDGSMLASGANDRALRLWHVATR